MRASGAGAGGGNVPVDMNTGAQCTFCGLQCTVRRDPEGGRGPLVCRVLMGLVGVAIVCGGIYLGFHTAAGGGSSVLLNQMLGFGMAFVGFVMNGMGISHHGVRFCLRVFSALTGTGETAEGLMDAAMPLFSVGAGGGGREVAAQPVVIPGIGEGGGGGEVAAQPVVIPGTGEGGGGGEAATEQPGQPAGRARRLFLPAMVCMLFSVLYLVIGLVLHEAGRREPVSNDLRLSGMVVSGSGGVMAVIGVVLFFLFWCRPRSTQEPESGA